MNFIIISGQSGAGKSQAKKVLANPLMSAAFFSPVIELVSGPDRISTSVGGFFNPWVNGLLILQLKKTSKGPRIKDIYLKMISSSMDLRGKGPDELARVISTRLMEAQSELNGAAKSWDSSEQKNDQSDEWLELSKRLQSEIKTARDVLAPDGDPDKEPVRKAFGCIMESLKTGSNSAGLDLTGKEPKDWKETLQPVYVDEFKGLTVVVLASHRYPLSLLWMQMDENSAKPVKRWKILHISKD